MIHRILALALSVLALSSHLRAAETARIPIITGNTIVNDIALKIGGERVQVTCLLQPGIDPHTYQPVPEDVKRLTAAQLVLINGMGFEGWFEGLAKEAGFKGAVVIATKGIVPLKMEAEHEHEHGHGPEGAAPATSGSAMVDDPHAFNSIVNGVKYAENIRDALIAVDVAGTDGYRTRAAAYLAELRAADAWAKTEFSQIPRDQRKIITNHDALQYFAKEYGFEILAPNTALEDSQPSAKDLASLVEFIRKQHVKGVFLEYGKNEKIITQIAKEGGVVVGDELFLDGVGPAGTPANTYIGMFKSNVTSMVKGLK